jgi:hydroxymethylpyrimidine pyrophosphatase-like HAD family hydrolase
MTATAPRVVRLLAVDLDGTLLTPTGTTSSRTRAAVRGARDRGVTVVAATGRPIRSVLPLLEDGALDGVEFLAVGNGALVVDVASGDRLEETTMPARQARGLADRLRTALPRVGLAWETGEHLTLDPRFAALTRERPVVLDLDEAGIADDPVSAVHQLLALHPGYRPPGLAAQIARVLGADAVVTHSGGGLVEIADPAADKGGALRRLAGRLQIDLGDTVAFGDGLNDVSMLRTAGWSVAMETADDAVRAVCDETAVGNDRDGVARVLERLLGLTSAGDES